MQMKKVFPVIYAVNKKGKLYALIFWIFFAMCFLPIIALFFVSLYRLIIPLMTLFAILIGMIFFHLRKKERLFALCVLLVILNFLVWFGLGILSYTQNVLGVAGGLVAYLLLVPYAAISGALVYYLFSRAVKDYKRVINGSVIISIMIALAAVATDLIVKLQERIVENVVLVESYIGAGSFFSTILQYVSGTSTTSFLLVLLLFNAPFIRKIVQRKDYARLILYAIPLMVYLLAQRGIRLW